MTLQEIGRQWKKDPKDVAMEIVISDHGHTAQVISIMDEGDVRTAVSNPIDAMEKLAPIERSRSEFCSAKLAALRPTGPKAPM